MRATDIAIIALDGDAFERGRQHGAAQRQAILAFLADGLARLDAFLPEMPTIDGFSARLEEFGSSIASQTPELYRELEGMAAGAGISVAEAVLLQARRELAGYSRITTAGDCTTFARAGRQSLLAQTIDLAGDVEDQLCVLEIRNAVTDRRSLILSFTGLLGYLGVNDAGLAIGLNLVLGGEWKCGLPPYLAIRHLIDHCCTVGQAVEQLRNLDLASSRCFVLCDGRATAFVEALAGKFAVHHGRELAHTNHFLEPEFSAADEINVFARNASRRRLESCRSWLAARPANLDAESVFDLFSTEPVLVADRGNRRREKTVAAVAIEPQEGRLRVRAGDPRYSSTVCFSFASGSRDAVLTEASANE